MSRTIEQAKKRVRQFICGLHGHDALFHFDHRHVSLVCVVCGHESPGWDLNRTPPTVVARADTRRVALVRRPQLISARRTA